MLTPQKYPTLAMGTSNCSSVLGDGVGAGDLGSASNASLLATVPDFGPKNEFSDLYRLSYNLYPIIG